MSIDFTPSLTWQPDSTQPLPDGQAFHLDLGFAANLDKIQAAGAAVPNRIVESNGILDLRPFCPPVDNQGNAEDCVADSTTSGMEFCEIRNGFTFVKKSRLFLYYNARLQTKTTDQNVGTYIRLAFSTLTSLGTCTEATWAYDLNNIFIRPSWSAYQEAYANKTKNFYRIGSTGGGALIDDIRSALQAQHPVVFGMTVDQDYMTLGSDGIIAMPQPTRVGAGGHAQLIVGYDDNMCRWIVKNSWGRNWGDNGYAYVPWAYLDVSGANDLWVPTL